MKKGPSGSRRQFLGGVVAGAAGATAVGAGVGVLRDKARSLITPKEVEVGKPAVVGATFKDSRPANTARAKVRQGAPNVIAIVLDDVGFADLGCYGSEISTPNIDRLAKSGLQYTNFRTTAMCSPTRASFLTGLNHHSVGMGWLADVDSGYPGYRGDLSQEATTLAETLGEAGWNTFLVGKWHVNNSNTTSANGPYTNWPTHRGFERAYWFQGHSTDYFKPCELFDGVAPIEPPDQPGYFVNDDLTDRATTYLRTQKCLEPDRPFYLHLAYPGAHSPLQVPKAYRDAQKGRYDVGWDVIRAARLKRQKALGILPEDTELSPLSFSAHSWNSLSADEQRIYARYMEVYAGLVTNLDYNIGRLLDALAEIGALDNTLIMLFSDNGGSGEGTETGTPNVFAPAFGRPVPVKEALKFYDIMGEDGTFPHYPMGWACASNTPFKNYKQYTHLGGVADPLLVSWPSGIAAKGQLRDNFVHVIDLYPTILEVTQVKRSEVYRGIKLKPVEGQSIAPTFGNPKAPTRSEQYFEMTGQRAYIENNWRLVTRHIRGTEFTDDQWELYDLSKDPSETHDLAAQHPDIVNRLKQKWVKAAEQYNVFPLDDRNLVIRLVQDRQAHALKPHWEFFPPVERIAHDMAPIVCGLSHTVTLDVERPRGDEQGVLVAQGAKYAGWVLYLKDGQLHYEQSLVPWVERMSSSVSVPQGKFKVKYVQEMTARPFEGKGSLYINDKKVAEHTYERVLFSTGYDGFTIGADLGNQVSSAYTGPNPFAGKIRHVTIDIDTTPTNPVETYRFIKQMALNV
ncbi:arylsulfatase [Limnobacter litoralis]|uniref:Arylsulfatase n=1 Tax=Limnobacter litoralis TaxID=481366 RepID=A0ABQ5YMP8_9BURK|nr:arylsulfatase [Limnobacter litoralis]GLR25075.1 arylsulfatase [Limnobacter litoralis]